MCTINVCTVDVMYYMYTSDVCTVGVLHVCIVGLLWVYYTFRASIAATLVCSGSTTRMPGMSLISLVSCPRSHTITQSHLAAAMVHQVREQLEALAFGPGTPTYPPPLHPQHPLSHPSGSMSLKQRLKQVLLSKLLRSESSGGGGGRRRGRWRAQPV